MNKLKVFVLATILATSFIGINLSNPSPVSAACSGATLTVYDDWYLQGHQRTFCKPAYASSLQAIDGPCSWFDTNWDNCISSLVISGLSGTQRVCFYEDPVFQNSKIKLNNGVYSALVAMTWDGELANPNDAISSFKWISSGSC